MAQTVSRRPLTALSPGFAPESIHVGFVVYKVELGQVFLRVLRLSFSISSFNRRSPYSYYVGDEHYMLVAAVQRRSLTP
jgi:hypothetical protein